MNTRKTIGHLRKKVAKLCYKLDKEFSTNEVDMYIQNIVTKPEKKTNDGNMIRIVLSLALHCL